MSTHWTLNNRPLSSWGLRIIAGNFRAQGVSTMTLERAVEYDAPSILPYGTPVILARNSVPYFQGRVASVPKYASGSEEGQTIEVADAWDELEKTIYQETWAAGASGTVMQPRSVLGIGKVSGAWANLNVGQQITAVVAYAIAQGLALQMGSVPSGERLLPHEVSNISCAEAIQMALKYHPDWIPWIDHSTTPPTLNVTPIGTATAASFPLDGTGEVIAFEVTSREDLLPASVRIVYESADELAGDVYRKIVVDKYPPSGPDGGPQVLTATIPLEGMRAQIQKSRIQTRALPGTAATAKAWLKKKFPQIAAIADADLHVATWSLELVSEDDGDFPQPVSPQAPRLKLEHLSQATHELVRGTLEDWMRRRSGPVRVYFELTGNPSLSDAQLELLRRLPASIIVTGTNAVTKTYKSISSWSAAESTPVGIAQAVYTALHASMPYQGSVTVAADEIPSVPYHGRVVCLPPTWASMAAPVHSVDWDVGSGTMRLGFGPAPHLAPADFLEMQRIMRARPVTWWTFEERGASALGAESGPSASGDTVGGFEAARAEPEAKRPPPAQFEVSAPFYDPAGGTWKARVYGGWVLTINPTPGTVMGYVAVAQDSPTIGVSHKVYCKVTTDKNDLVTSALIHTSASVPTDAHAQPDPGGSTGTYHYLLASFKSGVGGVVEVDKVYHQGPIIHRPARNNRNLKLIVHQLYEDCGILASVGSPETAYWRRGLYVGKNDPADGATQDILELTHVNGIS